MAHVDLVRKEVVAKIVYYGTGLSGKTANLDSLYEQTPNNQNKPIPIAAEEDQSLFYEFMSIDLGMLHGLNTRLQLYTVPGQVRYNATRKMVLHNVDGIVFVADSQEKKWEDNLRSLKNLEENLRKYVIDITSLPIVFQYNKRDLPEIMSVETLNETLNQWGNPYMEAVAVRGLGVFPTLKILADQVLEHIRKNRGTTRYYI